MAQDTDNLISEVRSRIDEKYRNAIKGLDAIRDFLGDAESSKPKGIAGTRTPERNGLSFRDRVLAVMNGEWHTAQDIAARCGLPVASVRGVVYAPHFRKNFKKRKAAGRAQFKLVQPKPTVPPEIE